MLWFWTWLNLIGNQGFNLVFILHEKNIELSLLMPTRTLCSKENNNTFIFALQMDAYRFALLAHVDCIEVDVSRSLDGALFALHDRYILSPPLLKIYQYFN